MNKPIKTSMTAMLLWSVAVVPAATVSYMATADAAYAKSDNAGGNGNGGGNSGNSGKSSNAGGKSSKSGGDKASSSSKGGGNGKSATRASGSDPVGRVLDRVLGRDKKVTRTKTKTRKSSPAKSKALVARSKAPKARAKTDPMHPSNLGNMNGALNANVNAVLAHIKNGNTNGPVGHLAALAVANVNADGAQEVIDLKQDFTDLQTALEWAEYTTVAEYYEALDGVEPMPNADIDGKVTALNDAIASQDALDTALVGSGYATDDEYLAAVADGAEVDPGIDAAISGYMNPVTAQDDLDSALSGNGYEGETALADYEVDRDGVAGIVEIVEVSDAIDTLGGDVETRADVEAEEPSEDDVAGAEENIAAQDGAELAILDYWNKNGDTDPAISDEEQALLDKLNERLDAEADAISAAVGTDDPVIDDDEGDDVAECEADDESCGAPVDEELAAAE